MAIMINSPTTKKCISVISTLAIAGVLMGGLSACGSRPGTRAATGAGIGVVGAYVLGAPLLAGAAVGAVAGVATTPDNGGDGESRRDRQERRDREDRRDR